MKFSNPRTKATIEDWPSGGKRVTAEFYVETNKRGQRVGRVTTGKPKFTVYHKQMILVDGDDGRIYAVGTSNYADMLTIYEGTLKTTESVWPGSDEHAELEKLLTESRLESAEVSC